MRKNHRHAIAISLTLAIFMGFFIGAQPRARAAEPTVENPVLFTVRGKLVGGGTSLQYDIDINGIYAGQSYLSANIVYPVQLTLNTVVLGTTLVCQNSTQTNCWGISTQKSGDYATTNMIWRGTPARTAAQLKDALEPLYFTLTNPGVFPPDPSTVAIEASADKVTQFVDENNFVHWYKFVSQSNVTWIQAYNAAQKARMQDPRDPENTNAVLDGYMATITSHAEQMKVYNDIAKDCGWLGGTRILKGNGRRPILDDSSLPETFPGSGSTGYVTNTGSPDAHYWYWADGPEAGHIFFTPGTTGGGGKTIGYPGAGTPGNLPAAVQPGGSAGFTGWNYYSFFGNAEPNNYYSSAADPNIDHQGEYFLQFAYSGASNPSASSDQNYPSYVITNTADSNYQPATARWNDFPGPGSDIKGYYVEFGGYQNDPKAEDLNSVAIQSISTVDLVMPIQIRYRSTEALPLDPVTYESHRQMTGLGTGNDRLITYEKDLPYTAVRDITPAGNPFTPPAGYTYYDWEFWGNPDDEANLSADASSVSGFHSLHYQYLTFLYQPVDVQVSFDANFPNWNSASVTPQTKTVKYDTPYGELATATQPGYTFTGWYTQASGGSLVDSNTVVTQRTAHTLYAHWTENTNYTVTYDLACPAGATCSATPAQKTNVAWTANNLLPGGATPTATSGGTTSHIFVGWDVAASGLSTGKQGVTASDRYSELATSSTEAGITLRARWIDARYIWVLYRLNGGTTATPLEDMYSEVHIGAVPLPQPQRAGYTFTGWMVTDDGTGHTGDTYPSSTEITYAQLAAETAKYIVVEAQWAPNTYTVTYNGNGATWTGAPKTDVLWDSNGFTPPAEGNPTRNGFVFMGWNTDCEGRGVAANSGTTYSVLAGGDDQVASVTLYAQWQAERTYFVRYDTNGGTPSTIPDLTGIYFGSANLLPASPTPPTGYSFSGWKVTYNGTKSGVQPGDTFGSLAADPNAGFIVLQAQYSPTQRYQLQYDVATNGGDGPYLPVSKGFSTNDAANARYSELVWTQSGLVPLVDPVKTTGTVGGVTCTSAAPCTFLGWNTRSDGTGHTVIPSDSYGDIATSAGVTQCTPLMPDVIEVVGQQISATTNVTIPAHKAGDMIVIVARRANNTAPTKPNASGTVPNWIMLGSNSGANTLSQGVYYFIATASNHTSGTWTNASQMIAMVLRSNQGTTLSIGGSGSINNAASTAITRPSYSTSSVPSGGSQRFFTAIGKAGSPSIDTTVPSATSLVVSAANNLTALYAEPSLGNTTLTNASSVATTVTGFQVIAQPGPQSATGCTKVYAIFAPAKSYTVIYDLNGGSGSIGNQTLGNVSLSVPLPTPTPPTGYEFSHWYVSNNGNGMSNPAPLVANTPYSTLAYGDGTSAHPYKNTITLRASYELKHTFGVVYDWNYANAPTDPNPATGVTWTQSGFAPHTATQSGKTLLGWTMDAGGTGSFVLPGTPFSTLAATFCAARPGDCAANGEPNVPIPLFAQWENASFTVQYDLNGIAAPVGWVNSRSVGFDDAGLIPDTSALNRVGYELVGWKVSVNGATAAMVQPSDSYRTLATSGASYITLQAQWLAKSYVVHYSGGWGGADAIPSTPSSGNGAVTWNSAVPFPTNPTRPGWTFAGWELWKRGSVELPTPIKVEEGTLYKALALANDVDYSNITLRATWLTTYEVTVTQDGAPLSGLTPSQLTVTSGGKQAAFVEKPGSPGVYQMQLWDGTFTVKAFDQQIGEPFVAGAESGRTAPFWTISYVLEGTEPAFSVPWLEGSKGVLANANVPGKRLLGWAYSVETAPNSLFAVGSSPEGVAVMTEPRVVYAVWADASLQIEGLSGSIVVNKYKDPSHMVDVHGDGMESSAKIADLAVEPAPGAAFVVCPVFGWDGLVGETAVDPVQFQAGQTPFDSEWWGDALQVIDHFNNASLAQRSAFVDGSGLQVDYTNCHSGVTGEDGISGHEGRIVFGDSTHNGDGVVAANYGLPLGLYIVHECVVGADVWPEQCGPEINVSDHGYIPADDYLVSLPYMRSQDAEGEGIWITRNAGEGDPGLGEYIVWTYPKNSSVDITKTADTSDTYSVGSHIHYTITTHVPSHTALGDHELESSIVVDLLGTGLSLPESMRRTAAGALVQGDPAEDFPQVALVGIRALVLHTDFEIRVWPEDHNAQQFAIELIGDGLALVNDHENEGAELTITYDAVVNELVGAIGQTENQAKVSWNNGAARTDVPTKFGGVLIHKRNALTGEPVDGAVFQLYGANPYPEGYDCDSDSPSPECPHPIGALNASGEIDSETLQGAKFFSQCSKDIGELQLADEYDPESRETPQEACRRVGGDWARDEGVVPYGTNLGEIIINGLHYNNESDEASAPPTCYVTHGSSGWLSSHAMGSTAVENNVEVDTESAPGSVQYRDATDHTLLHINPASLRLGTWYWLVETTVPEGYVGENIVTPVCVTGQLDLSSQGYDDFIVGDMPDEVGVRLPFTGELDKQIPMLLGIVFIVGGFTAYVVRTRKANARADRARRA